MHDASEPLFQVRLYASDMLLSMREGERMGERATTRVRPYYDDALPLAPSHGHSKGVRPLPLAGSHNQGVSRARSRGNVLARRILGTPVSCRSRRSSPIAKPPCGGMP